MSQPLYMENTYLFEATANVKSVGEDDRGAYFLLDQTIFHPQGGGQPSDRGTVTCDGVSYDIDFVDRDGRDIKHYYSGPTPAEGAEVHLKIDPERRLNNAANHTAGHLLADIMVAMAPYLTPTKAYHFPEGPYVEFKGDFDQSTEDAFMMMLNVKLKKILDEGELTLAEMGEFKGAETQRQVAIGENEPIPCGGTHLEDVSELAEVVVRKMKYKKGILKVSYTAKLKPR